MDPKTFTIPPPKDMHDYFSSAPFTTRTFIEFLRRLDLEQKLRSAEQGSIHGIYTKLLNSLSENQDLPQFARDHAKRLMKELSSKETVSFWDSIVEREKRRAVEEHDYKLLEQVRNKHVTIGGSDVVRVQKEYKVDEESSEASTEKKRKDEDDATSTPPTKKSRSDYESSYSPSSSEMERLPSLATDSVFDNDDDERDVPQLSDDDSEEKEELESDDEGSDIIINENILSIAKAVKSNNSEWKLSSGELISNVLSQKTLMVIENSKNKRLTAFTASVVSRLGLSSIVDLTSEFQNGMYTWFGEEWPILKQKARSRINMLPMKFEGRVLESIEKIEDLCLEYRYWDVREYLLEQMKDRSATKFYLQIMKIYFTIMDMFLNDPYIFVDEDGKGTKLTEMEYVLKTVAPVMDIVFSDVNNIVKLRWGETVSKASTALRKIDLRIETRRKCIELSHTECARAPTPAKIVRDRSKILRTNKCILDKYLRRNLSDQDVENSAVFAFQFAGLYGQLLAVDLFDNGLYFGLEGPDFKFPSQLPNIKPLRQTLEERIIQKVTVLSQFDTQFDTQINPYKKVFHIVDEKQPEPKHKKIKFIRSTYFTPRGRNQK
ncbi:1449_t:CDS:10 [Funneliformis caledonium]|uniref:1449_t:CDS:1 n=1 Tax=Funneliformis caledonium TaxID=1117310 RepID=A0A9N9GKE5_9GLOM|nr:1449_t:CDS:10 [Funneliformis caledonium]